MFPLPRRRTGLVLAGASALGAYEAGVVRYVAEDLAREIDREVVFDVLSGASAGAINAATLAAFADQPALGASRLCNAWTQIRLGEILRPSAAEILWMLLDASGSSPHVRRAWRACARVRGGLLDPASIERLLFGALPMERVRDFLQDGTLHAVAVSATHVATGRAVVFFDCAEPVRPWRSERTVLPVATRLGVVHALASAAVPLLFPPVLIEGDLYCDGGLRQIVPLAPAIHLGADRLLLVNPLSSGPVESPSAEEAGHEALSSPIYLAGKALNALFVDRMEADVSRVKQLNDVLDAGTRRFGSTFAAELGHELERTDSRPLRHVDLLRIEPSQDLGALAVEYAGSRPFAARERSPAVRCLRRLAAGDPARSGDLLSYLLFDGAFAGRLIELGRSDARARRSELIELLSDAEPAHRNEGRRIECT